MAGFPLIKLAFLAVKQVAKPVASRLKSYALDHPTYRRGMVRVGRMLHANALQLDRVADGKTRLVKVVPLEEGKALERAGDFLAEGFIYAISASILGAEYVISKRKDEKKAAEEQKAAALRVATNESQQWAELERLNHEMAELRQTVAELRQREDERRRRGWWSRR